MSQSVSSIFRQSGCKTLPGNRLKYVASGMSGLLAILTAVRRGIRLVDTPRWFTAFSLAAYQLFVTQRPKINARYFFQMLPRFCVEVEIASLLYGLCAIPYISAVFFAASEETVFIDAALQYSCDTMQILLRQRRISLPFLCLRRGSGALFVVHASPTSFLPWPGANSSSTRRAAWPWASGRAGSGRTYR